MCVCVLSVIPSILGTRLLVHNMWAHLPGSHGQEQGKHARVLFVFCVILVFLGLFSRKDKTQDVMEGINYLVCDVYFFPSAVFRNNLFAKTKTLTSTQNKHTYVYTCFLQTHFIVRCHYGTCRYIEGPAEPPGRQGPSSGKTFSLESKLKFDS